jgi:hypothetical protein
MRRLLLLSLWVLVGWSPIRKLLSTQQSIWQQPDGIILELPWKIRIAKRPAGQRFEDRITLFAAALEAASNGEKQTQTSPEDDP